MRIFMQESWVCEASVKWVFSAFCIHYCCQNKNVCKGNWNVCGKCGMTFYSFFFFSVSITVIPNGKFCMRKFDCGKYGMSIFCILYQSLSANAWEIWILYVHHCHPQWKISHGNSEVLFWTKVSCNNYAAQPYHYYYYISS